MDLDEYRHQVASLPRPTLGQMEAFARHVFEAHSWYKHLPLLPPGRTFRVFVDPFAGQQIVEFPDGRAIAEIREGPGLHYSCLPTAVYLERFGHLSFSQSRATQVISVDASGTRRRGADGYPGILDASRARWRSLPEEVLRAGACRLRGLIHTLSATPSQILWELAGRQDVVWPEESGGSARLDAVVARCRLLAEDRTAYTSPPSPSDGIPIDFNLMQVDWDLHQLLVPERERQRVSLVDAMRRVVALVDGSGDVQH